MKFEPYRWDYWYNDCNIQFTLTILWHNRNLWIEKRPTIFSLVQWMSSLTGQKIMYRLECFEKKDCLFFHKKSKKRHSHSNRLILWLWLKWDVKITTIHDSATQFHAIWKDLTHKKSQQFCKLNSKIWSL